MTSSDAEITGMISAGNTAPITEGDGSTVINVIQDPSNVNRIIITGTSTVRGVTQEIKAALRMSPGNIFDFAVAAKGKVTIANAVEIQGGVATNASYSGSKDPFDVSPNAELGDATLTMDAGLIFPDVIWPSSFDVEESSQINEGIYFASGDTYIHFQGGVSVPDNKTLDFQGSGNIHLFIDNGWSMHNQAILNLASGVNLFVYVTDGSAISIRSDSFEGLIYAPNSDVTVKTVNKNREIVGSVIGKTVLIEGNHTTLSYDGSMNLDTISVEKSYVVDEWL